MSSFVLELSEIESKIAELVINEAGGKFSKIGKLSVGSNQIIHNELRSEVLKYQNIGSAPVKTEISFCCGPTQKAPTWSPSIYTNALIGHSHCSTRGIDRIKQVQELIRSLLGVPNEYKILLMNGSATAALECAFFNLLGHNNIQNFSFDVFGRRWAGELEIMTKNLQNSEKKHIFLRKIDYNVDDIRKGVALNEAQFDPKSDLVLVHTGTSTGYVWDQHFLKQPINKDRAIISDATSAAFVEDFPWQHLDAVAFSFQKVLGCEAGLGCLILSPNACELIIRREKVFLPPRILRLNEEMITKIADKCELVNTISMLNLHEIYNSLHWAAKSGGVKFLRKQATINQEIIASKMTDELEFLLPDPKTRAKSLLAIRPSDPKLQTWDFVNKVATIADKHGVVSIAGHPHEAPCWRFWTGPTVQNTAEGFDRFLKAFAMG
jgi:phosphoserine aminotransferase